MAVQIKANPTIPNTARSFNGKSVTSFVVTPGDDFTAERGPNGALQAVIRAITQAATPVMISAAADIAAPVYTVFIEGDFNITDTWDGENSETFAVYLQSVIRDLGANAAVRNAAINAVTGETISAGVDLTGATVTVGALFQADQVN